MAKAKMMNENVFEKMTKEFGALGELIRTRQDEKQAVMDEFDKERKRYNLGKISENTLASSVKKTNAELLRIDKNIRLNIQKAIKLSGQANDFLRRQQPKVFRVHESGTTLNGTKKKSVKKKVSTTKVSKKQAHKKASSSKVSERQLKKELAMDKKFSK